MNNKEKYLLDEGRTITSAIKNTFIQREKCGLNTNEVVLKISKHNLVKVLDYIDYLENIIKEEK